jgi:hypothetical protein
MVFNQIKDVMMIETDIPRELLGLLFFDDVFEKRLPGWMELLSQSCFSLIAFPRTSISDPNASLNWMEESAPAALGL